MPSLTVILRRASSVALTVSFVAMAISGMLMLALEDQAGFLLRMHPVHNVFGLVMIASGLVHVGLSWGALVKHLRHRWAAILGVVLAAFAALLLVEGLTASLDAAAISRLQDAYSAVHQGEHER